MQLWDIDAGPNQSIKGRFQRDANGHEVWVLSLKRAWQFMEKQWVEVDDVEVYDDPLFLGEPGFSSMVADHDFPVLKRNTDVIIYGKARSYANRPVKHHQCRLLIDGHIDKTLDVIGPRQWVSHGGSITVSTPQAFIVQDVDYCHALGGDHRNRLGCGIAQSNQELLSCAVPSVFYSSQDWQANTDKVEVAGFGPLPPFFSERLSYAGTYDETWFEERRPLLPLDFDVKFYQCAPKDQQCKSFLNGGERVMVSGFSHDDVLSFRIPSEQYQAVARFGEDERTVDMKLYTLWINTEKMRIEATYTAAFPCQGQEHTLVSSKVLPVVEVLL
ncbi:DUF2169 domain-containing protein [uncultured Photobacterium sp.]|uniref:DUF2169 family type VI secretion system accessory protein n=1 Tax=uncultured Photobacterium sp. TaxID=173973 RepID=UPI002629E98F|nr:DUF2169 domain-containing protein [uncultured Photobacterium sp.]